MGTSDDDQVDRENRQQDAADARKQAERHSETARGFSHNPEALTALYGYPRPVSAYPAGYEADLRGDLRRSQQRLLEQRRHWPDPEPKSLLLGDFMGRLRAEDIFGPLSEMDVTDPDAATTLERLLDQVTRAVSLQSMVSGLHDPTPAEQRYARDLEWVKVSLEHLIHLHEHYRKVVASRD